jgi:hypothetical protein
MAGLASTAVNPTAPDFDVRFAERLGGGAECVLLFLRQFVVATPKTYPMPLARKPEIVTRALVTILSAVQPLSHEAAIRADLAKEGVTIALDCGDAGARQAVNT